MSALDSSLFSSLRSLGSGLFGSACFVLGALLALVLLVLLVLVHHEALVLISYSDFKEEKTGELVRCGKHSSKSSGSPPAASHTSSAIFQRSLLAIGH